MLSVESIEIRRGISFTDDAIVSANDAIVAACGGGKSITRMHA